MKISGTFFLGLGFSLLGTSLITPMWLGFINGMSIALGIILINRGEEK